jgi:hypothetical protein
VNERIILNMILEKKDLDCIHLVHGGVQRQNLLNVTVNLQISLNVVCL